MMQFYMMRKKILNFKLKNGYILEGITIFCYTKRQNKKYAKSIEVSRKCLPK